MQQCRPFSLLVFYMHLYQHNVTLSEYVTVSYKIAPIAQYRLAQSNTSVVVHRYHTIIRLTLKDHFHLENHCTFCDMCKRDDFTATV